MEHRWGAFGVRLFRWRISMATLSLIAAALSLCGCGDPVRLDRNGMREPGLASVGLSGSAGGKAPLTLLSLSQDASAKYDAQTLREFGAARGTAVQYIPSGGDSVNNQLDLYQEIMRRHYSEPDILMIDTVWPAMLASDLVDLKPYLQEAIAAAEPVEVQNDTVDGRVIGIPLTIDFGVLFYRPVLLKRYGFTHAPETWDELEHMARVIQAGERKRGQREFWGYGWAGGDHEALTCAALEWFLSNSGTNFVEQDGSVRLNNAQNVAAVKRAQSWIGTISPKGVPLYHESDVENLWRAGQVAFARGWVNTYKSTDKPVGGDALPFEVAPVPAGPRGHASVLGDMSLSVSKYAANRELAIEALKAFTSHASERKRLLASGIIPTRRELFLAPETSRYTLLRNPTAQSTLGTLVTRPATLLGRRYDAATKEVSSRLNAVLLGRQTAETALADLQEQLQMLLRSK